MAKPIASPDSPEIAAPESASGGLPIAKILIGLAAVAALIVLGRTIGGYIPEFNQWVNDLGFWGPAVFILAYATAVVAFVPASLLTLGAGAIFGLAAGTVYVFIAATLGSALAFLVSRYVARGAVEKKIEGDQRFAAIDRAVGDQGRKIVFLLRLSPVFPFNLLNYALGLTKVRFADYVTASVGMLPGTLLYVYLGKVGADVAALAGGGADMETAASETAFKVVGLIATLAVTIYVTRIARRALNEATGQ